MSTVAVAPQRVALDLIDVGENVRELDPRHVEALASSIALRGLIVPLVVRPNGDHFTLVAGFHRYAACRSVGLQEVEITSREQEGSSADSAAENVVRKQLSPLEEARAVQHMLDEGYTLDGAASVLGWSRKLVTERAKILALPQTAQQLLGNGKLPVSAVAVLGTIAEVSSSLCEAAVGTVASERLTAEQFCADPGWAIGCAIREGAEVFAAYLSALHPSDVEQLRLGKKVAALLEEAEQLHKKLTPYAYGPPPIRFAESEIDQARAAGVLIEFERGERVIADKALYRQLAKQAISRTVEELRAEQQASDSEQAGRRARGKKQRTPLEKLDVQHRANLRALAARAHGTNLDLGAALVQGLAAVDPKDMDVARFFAYGVLGPEASQYGREGDTVATIAANGIRLVIGEHRTTTTPILKSGGRGKTKVVYGEVEDATAWLWKFIDGAKTASELYGRVLVVFAAQHYAENLVLPASKRRRSAAPRSRKDVARKALERVAKKVLPASHVQLQRALEREARAYAKAKGGLTASPKIANAATTSTSAESTDAKQQVPSED
ncbi:MAG TPA: ParB/RepB/Spo0J family partition protein [Solirubrobacteraceae bacterium]|nr:ParB/RepB/Spo0J family partition protein [Solirubrobacteraceae bacterium]